ELSLVDARSWLEYITGHIPGAELFKRDRVLAEIPKDRSIVVACLSGHRSTPVAQWLVEQGYTQVYNLQGGLMAWKGAGYPVKAGNQA
ncbi:MAG: rhodanese-like domain-containing protein, partial [Chamaesiphon sp.]|nr:rhodanese-like domain-containing protein [Chamaesiphon sp.]